MTSIRTKKNIALALTVLGGVVLASRILQAVLSSEAMGWGAWFKIFGAAVITACMFNIYRSYAKRLAA